MTEVGGLPTHGKPRGQVLRFAPAKHDSQRQNVTPTFWPFLSFPGKDITPEPLSSGRKDFPSVSSGDTLHSLLRTPEKGTDLFSIIGSALKIDLSRFSRICPGFQSVQLLASIPGFGRIGAAELIGEIGTFDRFPSEAALAIYVGMAPLDNSSGLRQKGKKPKCVNSRCQSALMTCLVRHTKCVAESRNYYGRKRAQGKTHNQAVRALGRHLIRVIWQMMKTGREYEEKTGRSE